MDEGRIVGARRARRLLRVRSTSAPSFSSARSCTDQGRRASAILSTGAPYDHAVTPLHSRPARCRALRCSAGRSRHRRAGPRPGVQWAGKTLVVGIHNRTPWGYRDKQNDVVGYHPDIVRAVLAPLGVTKFEFVVADFGALIPGLLANRFDIIASGVAITPARCQQVLFSEPDLSVGDGLLVLKGNPLKLHSYEDIAKNPQAQARRRARHGERQERAGGRRAGEPGSRCSRTTRRWSAPCSPAASMRRRCRRRASASSRSRSGRHRAGAALQGPDQAGRPAAQAVDRHRVSARTRQSCATPTTPSSPSSRPTARCRRSWRSTVSPPTMTPPASRLRNSAPETVSGIMERR